MPSDIFEPSKAAALARVARVDPSAYARSRNALDGAVTRLSPYLTHGWLTLAEVYAAVQARAPMDRQHKLVFELGWRAYWRHVWAFRGDAIHRSLHAGVLPEEAYARALPDDFLAARTGIAVIDRAVQTLLETGYLHNHARMWLASYLVHFRKVHWHVGAQWMLGHLLDGDIASNHLSWQWVAGTGSHKPYLFNAENVAKYAPAGWHSPNTPLDTSYEALDEIARTPGAVLTFRGRRMTTQLALTFPAADAPDAPDVLDIAMPAPLSARPPSAHWTAPDASLAQGRDVVLVHPWSVAALQADAADGSTASDANGPNHITVAVALQESHAATPWSAKRWDFVSASLQTRTSHLWTADVAQLAAALQGARSVCWQSDPHIDSALARVRALWDAGVASSGSAPAVTVHHERPLFGPVERRCDSFAKWWREATLLPGN